jgi:hypothetical protein
MGSKHALITTHDQSHYGAGDWARAAESVSVVGLTLNTGMKASLCRTITHLPNGGLSKDSCIFTFVRSR